jgi:hypothetical protein
MSGAGRLVATWTVLAVIQEKRPASAVRSGWITQGVTR